LRAHRNAAGPKGILRQCRADPAVILPFPNWRPVAALALLIAGCGGAGSTPDPSPDVSTAPPEQTTVTTSAAPSPAPSVPTNAPTTAPPSTTTTAAPVGTPLEIAAAWIDAFEAGDVERFQSLMHPDATANCINCAYDRQEAPYFSQLGEGTADVSDSRLLALGNGALNADCSEEGSVVTCDTLWMSDFGYFTAEGEPTRQWDVTYEFTIEDGLITRRIIINRGGASFDFGRVADYEDWLEKNHPEVHEKTFAFGTILLTTSEHFALHQKYVPEYMAAR
jgi:hypothetical protein